MTTFIKETGSQVLGFIQNHPKMCAAAALVLSGSTIYPTVYQWITDHSILHALDSVRMQRELLEKGQMSLLAKIGEGVVVGIKGLCISTFLSLGYDQIFKTDSASSSDQNPFAAEPFVETVFLTPIREEFICRWAVQNMLHILPIDLSTKILLANTFFALTHLTNFGPFDREETLFQVARIACYPKYSILYETTGTILSPLAAHITHNGLITMAMLGMDELRCRFAITTQAITHIYHVLQEELEAVREAFKVPSQT